MDCCGGVYPRSSGSVYGEVVVCSEVRFPIPEIVPISVIDHASSDGEAFLYQLDVDGDDADLLLWRDVLEEIGMDQRNAGEKKVAWRVGGDPVPDVGDASGSWVERDLSRFLGGAQDERDEVMVTVVGFNRLLER